MTEEKPYLFNNKSFTNLENTMSKGREVMFWG